MSCFHLMQLDNVPIFQQLQLEEALLRIDNRNWCIVNKGTPPAIVLGISGKAEEHIDLPALANVPIPVIRRFSGGGTVVVDEHTTFVTWIANSGCTGVDCCPKKVMQWTANLYQRAFKNVDFQLIENDYAIGHKKCGGNAQYMRRDRWLHHTSFLWDYHPERMQLLKKPPKMPHYRQDRSHANFLCRLHESFASYGEFLHAVLNEIQDQFDIIPTELADVSHLLHAQHRKATTLLNIRS